MKTRTILRNSNGLLIWPVRRYWTDSSSCLTSSKWLSINVILSNRKAPFSIVNRIIGDKTFHWTISIPVEKVLWTLPLKIRSLITVLQRFFDYQQTRYKQKGLQRCTRIGTKFSIGTISRISIYTCFFLTLLISLSKLGSNRPPWQRSDQHFRRLD